MLQKKKLDVLDVTSPKITKIPTKLSKESNKF